MTLESSTCAACATVMRKGRRPSIFRHRVPGIAWWQPRAVSITIVAAQSMSCCSEGAVGKPLPGGPILPMEALWKEKAQVAGWPATSPRYICVGRSLGGFSCGHAQLAGLARRVGKRIG